ncbi:MAG TPA: 16S rRNA (cytosine(1402)-N(4))-methyltransferase RsmH [Exilispira sp.]|nr:16S rRNA (cytosine(1402)-N(4))-methyltransferase RsmH [Exilispira sp.]HOV46018.1 16S rRNA (cytosine(1402)-N(4))-methyltransferase RsmH [Exilispira sp.]HPO60382.1 16S rRNA (cytosine(1402)-N(4))-methyltransferase RsmH [Exilispira sp.]
MFSKIKKNILWYIFYEINIYLKKEISINYHTPVLINEICDLAFRSDFDEPDRKNYNENKIIIDACFGEGGYTDIFLQRFANSKIIGIEQDIEIFKVSTEKFKNNQRVKIINGNFKNVLLQLNNDNNFNRRIDLIVFDLGISMYHIKASNKGITFQKDQPLDMRLTSDAKVDASQIINKYSKQQLADIFYYNADERLSYKIADAIIEYRRKKPILTTGQLVEVVSTVKGLRQKGGINPATKVFQALRIAVNNEFENLEKGLLYAYNLLRIGGRIAVVSYHSGEDRIVKNFIRDNKDKIVAVNKKPLSASWIENKKNPSARSAKLRVFEKIK